MEERDSRTEVPKASGRRSLRDSLVRSVLALGILGGTVAVPAIFDTVATVNAQHHPEANPHPPTAPGHTDSEVHHDTTPSVSVSNGNEDNGNGRRSRRGRGRWRQGNDNGWGNGNN